MCGIIGGWHQNIEKGVKALLHRGPDAQGIISLDSLQLGHTRLSILDIDPRSNQPFKYGDTYLIFNGEIWNYKDLRSELERTGLTFNTAGDTEVLANVNALILSTLTSTINAETNLQTNVDALRLTLFAANITLVIDSPLPAFDYFSSNRSSRKWFRTADNV